MHEQFQFQQFFGGFVTPFIFTVPRFGFFVALYPRPRFYNDNNLGSQSSMTIQRITEQEYLFMRRIGIMEVPVSTGDGYRETTNEENETVSEVTTLSYMPDRPGTTIPFPWPVDLSNAALTIIDGLLYTLYTDRPTYLPGQPVNIMFIKTNISPVPRRLVYPTSQRFDLAVVQNEREIWRWSRNRAFTPAVGFCELLPGQSQIFPVVWNQETNNELGLEPGPGLFTLRATNMAAGLQNQAVELRVRIQVPTAPPEPGPETPQNFLLDPGFEAWIDPLQPDQWVGSNIQRSSVPYTGQFALQLGVNPGITAYASQEIPRITTDRSYRLVFHAREIPNGISGNNGPNNGLNNGINGSNGPNNGRPSNYVLNAEVVFLDRQGAEVGGGNLQLTSEEIPENNYQQYRLQTGPAPSTARTALVRFTLEPGTDNTSGVVIDDVSLVGI